MLKRFAVLLACLLFAAPVAAEATREGIVAELRQQGFTRIEISRTLLGRTRFVATGDGTRREIVLNPSTGVILRDYWSDVRGRDDDDGGPTIIGPSGTAGDDDDDDRDDDREDDGDGGSDDGGDDGSDDDDDEDEDDDDEDDDDEDDGDDDDDD